MRREDVQELEHGLYRVYWEDSPEAPSSLAAVGSDADGRRWLAPTNWVTVGPQLTQAQQWARVARVERIRPDDERARVLGLLDRDALYWREPGRLSESERELVAGVLRALRIAIAGPRTGRSASCRSTWRSEDGCIHGCTLLDSVHAGEPTRHEELQEDGSSLAWTSSQEEAQVRAAAGRVESALEHPPSSPVPMLLVCPACGERHVDEGEFAKRPHHTHACQGCGMCWRPAIVSTVGVRFLPGFKNESEASR